MFISNDIIGVIMFPICWKTPDKSTLLILTHPYTTGAGAGAGAGDIPNLAANLFL